MKKLTILGIFLICGLATSAIMPSVYAQTSKAQCKGTLYDGKNFKVWAAVGALESESLKVFDSINVCAKDGWTISSGGIGLWSAYKK